MILKFVVKHVLDNLSRLVESIKESGDKTTFEVQQKEEEDGQMELHCLVKLRRSTCGIFDGRVQI